MTKVTHSSAVTAVAQHRQFSHAATTQIKQLLNQPTSAKVLSSLTGAGLSKLILTCLWMKNRHRIRLKLYVCVGTFL